MNDAVRWTIMDDTESEPDGIHSLEGRDPGEDPADPYAEIDLASLPDWWRDAVETFRSHGLRPYRPPRFTDGVLKHEIVDSLEETLDVKITVRCFDPDGTDEWEVRIGGEPVTTVGHHRSAAGYSVFEIDSDAFAETVREHAQPR